MNSSSLQLVVFVLEERVAPWIATFAMHSTLLLLAALAAATSVRQAVGRDRIWKLALIGPLLTASIATWVGAGDAQPARGALDAARARVAGPFDRQSAGLPVGELATERPNEGRVAPQAAAERRTRAGAVELASEPIAILGWGADAAETESTSTGSRAHDANDAAPGRIETTTTAVSLTEGLEGETDMAAGSTRGASSRFALAAAAGWLLVALVLGYRLVRQRHRFLSDLGERRTVATGPLRSALDRIASGLPIAHRVRLTEARELTSPLAIGRDEICVPERAAAELDEAEQEGLVAHELAHLVRRDPLWTRGAQVLERLFFFQPLLRVVRRELQSDMELAADAWAAERTRDPMRLAHCLARVAEWVGERGALAAAPAMAAAPSQLVRRVEALLAPQDPVGGRRSARRVALLGLSALGAIALVGPSVRGASSLPVQEPSTLDSSDPSNTDDSIAAETAPEASASTTAVETSAPETTAPETATFETTVSTTVPEPNAPSTEPAPSPSASASSERTEAWTALQHELSRQGAQAEASGEADAKQQPDDAQAPERVEIAVGDTLRILDIFDADHVDRTEVVAGLGSIMLPQLGRVEVVGLTRAELEAILRQRYAEYFVDTEVHVQHTPKIQTAGYFFLYGAVEAPGRRELRADATLFEALCEAGFGSRGDWRGQVKLIRPDPTDPLVFDFDYEAMLRTGDTRLNLRLRAGDIVFVIVNTEAPVALTVDDLDALEQQIGVFMGAHERLERSPSGHPSDGPVPFPFTAEVRGGDDPAVGSPSISAVVDPRVQNLAPLAWVLQAESDGDQLVKLSYVGDATAVRASTVEPVKLWQLVQPNDPWDAGLCATLAYAAERMERRKRASASGLPPIELPDESLTIALAKDEPFELVQRILALCADPELGIWRLELGVPAGDRIGARIPIPLPIDVPEEGVRVATLGIGLSLYEEEDAHEGTPGTVRYTVDWDLLDRDYPASTRVEVPTFESFQAVVRDLAEHTGDYRVVIDPREGITFGDVTRVLGALQASGFSGFQFVGLREE